MTQQDPDPLPLPTCGSCNFVDGTVSLRRSCFVHGRLADWLATGTDRKIVEKVTSAAISHERTAAAWSDATTAIADFVEAVSERLRGK